MAGYVSWDLCDRDIGVIHWPEGWETTRVMLNDLTQNVSYIPGHVPKNCPNVSVIELILISLREYLKARSVGIGGKQRPLGVNLSQKPNQ